MNRPPRFVVATVYGCLAIACSGANSSTIEKIGTRVSVVRGPINGVRLEAEGKSLAVYGDPRVDPPPAERVLLTSSRRDVAWATRALTDQGATTVMPEKEVPLLVRPHDFWQRFSHQPLHNYSH